MEVSTILMVLGHAVFKTFLNTCRCKRQWYIWKMVLGCPALTTTCSFGWTYISSWQSAFWMSDLEWFAGEITDSANCYSLWKWISKIMKVGLGVATSNLFPPPLPPPPPRPVPAKFNLTIFFGEFWGQLQSTILSICINRLFIKLLGTRRFFWQIIVSSKFTVWAVELSCSIYFSRLRCIHFLI